MIQEIDLASQVFGGSTAVNFTFVFHNVNGSNARVVWMYKTLYNTFSFERKAWCLGQNVPCGRVPRNFKKCFGVFSSLKLSEGRQGTSQPQPRGGMEKVQVLYTCVCLRHAETPHGEDKRSLRHKCSREHQEGRAED